MPRYYTFNRLLAYIALPILLLACSGTPSHNETTFQAQIDQERLAANPVKTVVISHVNLGGVTRNYLAKEAPRIDAKVAAYLKDNGFKVLPQREFQQHWNTAVRAYGNPVDPTSGKVNRNTFSRIMISVRDQMAKNTNVDAFVFTDLLEVQVSFSGGMKHLARWHGVARKPSLQGPGNSVSADFDWNMQAAAASLQVHIYDMELKPLFMGIGGMDATEAIDTRSSKGRYIRRRNILENDNAVMEGIELAFHPFIEMKGWPGKP